MAAWQPGLALDSPGAWVATRSRAVPRPPRGHRLRLAPSTRMVVGPFHTPDTTLQTAGALLMQ